MRLGQQTPNRLGNFNSIRVAVLLAVIVGTVIFVRTRLMDVPLERDEGEFAYGAQMLLEGVSPYKHACNVMLKPPGTCTAYALAMALFGQTGAAIHLEVILITLGTLLLVFFLTRRICGERAGLVAAATYALLSINPLSLGLAAHATHFVMLPALAAVYLSQYLDDDTSSTRVFFAGLLLGLAALMKQTGAAFGLFAIVWVVRCELYSATRSRLRLAKRLGILVAGGLLPIIVTSCIVALSGDWDAFVFWTFKYAGLHSEEISFGLGIKIACEMVLKLFLAAPALWSLALSGAFLVWREPGLRRWRFFIVSFSFFSFLSAYPGWRTHYFIQFFPAAGVLAGCAFRALVTLSEPLKRPFIASTVLPSIFLVAAASALIQWREIYFTLTPAQVSRTIYGVNPFPEAVELGDYLAAHCSKDGKIVVLGSEPEIYVYSHRRAATRYVCTYPLMEAHAYALPMQKQMIYEIEENNPEYVVFVNVSSSWLRRSKSDLSIIDWFKEYRRERLRMVGLIEITPERTDYHWLADNELPLKTSAENWLAVYKRRDAN